MCYEANLDEKTAVHKSYHANNTESKISEKGNYINGTTRSIRTRHAAKKAEVHDAIVASKRSWYWKEPEAIWFVK